jgi:hypothetical protein
MAQITNYATLKTAVEKYLNRTGDASLSDEIDGMVQMAGSRLNRKLALRVMQDDAELTGTVGSREIALPDDFVEPYALRLTTFGDATDLKPSLAGKMPLYDSRGVPQAWSVDGANIALDHPCDQAHTFLFRYRKSFVLSEAEDTNWLLTNHPDIYLAAVCVWGGVFMLSDEDAVRFKVILEEGLEELAWQESRSKSIATLSVDPALTSRGRFNIISG